MLMRAKDSTLLVIDLQERLLPAIDGGAAVVEHATWLVRVAQRLQVPVIATEQYPKGLGYTEPALHELLPGDGLREKIHFSATAGAGVFDLPGGERQQFVVCGTETHVCVLQTVLGLLAAGREVFVVDEAVVAGDVRATLAEGAGELLEAVELFDVYRGAGVPEGRKSLAFSLRFRAPDRTLTAEEVSEARAAATALAAQRHGAVQR